MTPREELKLARHYLVQQAKYNSEVERRWNTSRELLRLSKLELTGFFNVSPLPPETHHRIARLSKDIGEFLEGTIT